MISKRIIPCLDVTGGKVVKGVKFVALTDIGDPAEIAKAYAEAGADELVFLDITATVEKRKTIVEVVRQVSQEVFMPLTVGGGIRTVADMQEMLRAGADKIAINSAAIQDPNLIFEGAQRFGSQCIVLAIDVKKNPVKGNWEVYTHGGRQNTGMDGIEWIKRGESLGAGELLVTSMDGDGTRQGYDIALYQEIARHSKLPIIASGGCGSVADMVAVFEEADVDAALAASIFHYGTLTIPEVKRQLQESGVPVRC